jgi:hypothetical protein
MGNDTSKSYVDASNNIIDLEIEKKRELEKREFEKRDLYAAMNLDIFAGNFKVMPIDNKGNIKK